MHYMLRIALVTSISNLPKRFCSLSTPRYPQCIHARSFGQPLYGPLRGLILSDVPNTSLLGGALAARAVCRLLTVDAHLMQTLLPAGFLSTLGAYSERAFTALHRRHLAIYVSSVIVSSLTDYEAPTSVLWVPQPSLL